MPGCSTPEPMSTAVGLEDDGAEDLEARPCAGSSRSRRRRRRHPRRRAARRTRRRRRASTSFAVTPCAGEEVADEARVARGDADALEVGELGERAGRAGEAEGGVAEVERRDLDGRRAGVEQQVAAGDADVERAGADVGGDVARTEVEELDVVAGVGDDAARAGRGGRRTRPRASICAAVSDERALVGHGDSEHGPWSLRVDGTDRR